MTEKMQADVPPSRQAGFVRCCLYNSNMIRYQPGTEVELRIDPGDPLHIYDPGTRKMVSQGYMLTLIFPAAVLLGAAVSGIFLYVVRKMQIKW